MRRNDDPDVTRLLRDLTRELQTLKREVDPESGRRLPRGQRLSRFTSEVAIPGLILLLETNIQALKLLRRTIRLAEGREPDSRGERAATEVRDRAEKLGEATLSRLDETLAEVQSSVENQEQTGEVGEMIEEARELQRQISNQLDPEGTAGEPDETGADSTAIEVDEDDEEGPVTIDVDAELESLKDHLEADDDPTEGGHELGDRGGEDGNEVDSHDGEGGNEDSDHGQKGGSEVGGHDGEDGNGDSDHGSKKGDGDGNGPEESE